MEASLYCGIPPQGMWLEIAKNMPWRYTVCSQLHSAAPHDKPAQSLPALLVSLQSPPGESWCPSSVIRPYISLLFPFLFECFLFSKDIFMLETSSYFCSLELYWEFLPGIPLLGILPPDFKGKRIIMLLINTGFSVMIFRPHSRQAGKHMFNIKHLSSLYSHAAS